MGKSKGGQHQRHKGKGKGNKSGKPWRTNPTWINPWGNRGSTSPDDGATKDKLLVGKMQSTILTGDML